MSSCHIVSCKCHTWKTWNGKGHLDIIWLLSCFKKRRLKARIKYMFLVLLVSCCRRNPSSCAKAYGTGPGKHLWYDVFHVAELGWLSWYKKQPVEQEEPNIQPPRLVTGTIETDTNQQKWRALNKYTSMITGPDSLRSPQNDSLRSPPQHTHLGHHFSTHLGHHRQQNCERVVTGGHSLRSPHTTDYIPLGWDMGRWGQPFRFWGLGHGNLGFRGGTWGQPFRF